jgi:hypothetical protein
MRDSISTDIFIAVNPINQAAPKSSQFRSNLSFTYRIADPITVQYQRISQY